MSTLKNKVFKNLKTTTLLVALALFSMNSYAGKRKRNNNNSQKCSKCHKSTHGGKCSKQSGGTQGVPLDGGLGILVLGAAAFGVKKLRKNENNNA